MGRQAAYLIPIRQGVAEAVGIRAAETLKKGRRGTVVSAFERSVYLSLEEAGDTLVSIGCADFPMGPINLSTTLPTFAGIKPGMPVHANGASLLLGDKAELHVDFAVIKAWRPLPARPWTPEAVARAMVALQSLERDRPEAFTAVIGGGSTVDDFVRRRAAAGAEAMCEWLSGKSSSDGLAQKGVEALLGLGFGLTPSGDDFLVGMLIALAELRDHCRFAALAQIVCAAAPGRTGRVSAAHLAAAIEGMAAEPLHRTVRAILAGGKGLEVALAALDAVGHSSGRDALAGASIVFNAVASDQGMRIVRT